MERLSEPNVRRLSENCEAVRSRIADAARRSGRDPAEIRLVAVTKTVTDAVVAALLELGERDLGENRPERIPARAREMALLGHHPRWHMIGHYQRRKIRDSLPYFSFVHSVHDEDLLRRLGKDGPAGPLRVPPKLLLQVNIAQEATKQGFSRDAVAGALERARAEDLPVVGLMTMGTMDADDDALARIFRGLRELRDSLDPEGLPELSMGMSADFPIAIAEGSTMVRVGSALFEGVDS